MLQGYRYVKLPFIRGLSYTVSVMLQKSAESINVCSNFQTRAAKPVLGKYYREPEKSGPLPLHLFGVLMRSLRVDHFVSDVGDVVYYQTDPQLTGEWEEKLK